MPLPTLAAGGAALVVAIATVLFSYAVAGWLAAEADAPSDADPRLDLSLLSSTISAAPRQAGGLALLSVTTTLLLLGSLDFTAEALALLAFAQILLCLGLIDLRTRLLPDAITLPMLWAGLLSQFHPALRGIGLEQAVAGAAAGYLLPWAAGAAYMLAGRSAPIGGGDLKLSAMMGAWLGTTAVLLVWFLAPVALLFACLPGVVSRRLRLDQRVPFGPWLALAGIVMLAVPMIPGK